MLLGALFLLSVTRVVTGADEITSAGTIGAALALAVPIGLAALGGLWSERAGVVNIGLEGMMILGTWFGAYAGVTYGIWWGVAAGALGGALGGLVHAIATVTFGVDHIVSGVAINIVAAGLARYLSVVVYSGRPGRRGDPVAADRGVHRHGQPAAALRPGPDLARRAGGQALVPALRRRRDPAPA